MKILLALFLLVPALFAQDIPAPAVSAIYQSKLQAIVLQKQKISLTQMKMQQKYQELSNQDAALSAKALEIEKAMFADLKSDIAKFDVVPNDEGLIVIIPKPPVKK